MLLAWPVYGQSLEFASLGDFRLESGATIRDCRLAYRTAGKLDAARSNVILFPTWFSGTTQQLIDGFIGAGKLADTNKYYVIAVDALGNGVSCSPSNSKAQPRLKFPQFTIRDMVRSQKELLSRLNIPHLYAVMGISMGGMQTFEWATLFPDFMEKAVPIAGTPRQTSSDLLLWNAELSAIESDKDWKDGNYTEPPALKTLARIHSFALTTPQFRARETKPGEFANFLTEAEKSPARFDAVNWVRQMQAMLSHDIGHGQPLESAASRIKAKMFVVVAAQDHMVNPATAVELSRLLGVTAMISQSDCGHMVTSCEGPKIVEEVHRFLSR